MSEQDQSSDLLDFSGVDTFISDKKTEQESRPEGALSPQGPWKVLVVDDEQDVHAVTRLVFKSISYRERGLEMISACSFREAVEAFEQNPDIALVLLDVIMETADAGLRFVRYLREEINNPFVRIVLRTGQPGKVPERAVVERYDINDYKTKTELTAEKFYTTVVTALRNYELLLAVDDFGRNMERKVREKTAEIEVLLHETIRGSIKTLSTILSLVNPAAFAKATRMLAMARKVEENLPPEKNWQLDLAVTLSQIGCIVVPEEILEKVDRGKPLSAREQEIYSSFPSVGSSLLKHIPHFKPVSEAIERQLSGEPANDEAVSQIAALLFSLSEIDTRIQRGIPPVSAFNGFVAEHPEIKSEITGAIREEILAMQDVYVVQEVPAVALAVGSILVSDILSPEGKLLVSRGHIVTDLLKIKILNWIKLNGRVREPVEIAIRKHRNYSF